MKNPSGIPGAIQIDSNTNELNWGNTDIVVWIQFTAPAMEGYHYRRALQSTFESWEMFQEKCGTNNLVTEGLVNYIFLFSVVVNINCPLIILQMVGL